MYRGFPNARIPIKIALRNKSPSPNQKLLPKDLASLKVVMIAIMTFTNGISSSRKYQPLPQVILKY